MSGVKKGVVVEFDFTAIPGADILFETTKRLLASSGKPFDFRLEAKHLYGGNYQGAFAELFEETGVRRDPVKSADELAAAFNAAVTERLAQGVTPSFRGFVKMLVEKDLKVVISTRGDVQTLSEALGDLVGDDVVVYRETANTYGSCKWDAWKRACHANGLVTKLTAGVTGSGFGAKAVLMAGMAALVVTNPHVEWQDFSGADTVVDGLDAAAAREIFRMLKVR